MKKRSPGLKSNKTGEKHIFVMKNNVLLLRNGQKEHHRFEVTFRWEMCFKVTWNILLKGIFLQDIMYMLFEKGSCMKTVPIPN